MYRIGSYSGSYRVMRLVRQAMLQLGLPLSSGYDLDLNRRRLEALSYIW